MLQKILRLSCIGVLVLGNQSCVKRIRSSSSAQDAWNAENDPAHFGTDIDRRYRPSLQSGQISKVPWSDTYWPSYAGGLAFRWQQGDVTTTWSYQLRRKEELLRMSQEEIKTLSPAEKYDIYMGRYDYPLTNRERTKKTSNALVWEGICHGWAIAALHWEEARPVTVKNPDGISIPFGASDIKGLISLGYDMSLPYPGYHRVGTRNDSGANPTGRGSQTAENDTNAGAFHIILTNFVKPGKSGIVMDAYTGEQVWNHPVQSYQTQEVNRKQGASPGAAQGTQQEVTVRTTVRYVTEAAPQWQPRLTSGTNAFAEATYEYALELNTNGDIIGGEWISRSRPDFVWLSAVPDFNNTIDNVNLSGIPNLYKASLGGATTSVEPARPIENTATTNQTATYQPITRGQSGTVVDTVPAVEIVVPRPTNTACSTLRKFSDCFPAWPKCIWQNVGAAGKCAIRQ